MKQKLPPKMIVNPDYLKATEQEDKDLAAKRGDFPEDIFPEEHNRKIPDDGCWIMLSLEVNVARGDVSIKVPSLSIWFAVPYAPMRGSPRPIYRAQIQHPLGSVCIFPHEYRIIDLNTYLEFTEEQGFCIHYMNEDAEVDPIKLFYLQSRGVGKSESLRMLLPEIKDPFYCYFTFHEEYQKMFEGVGTPRLMTINHERRKESRKRMKELQKS